ncbi:MAG: flavin reductase family protein [Micropruina sp.]|uniref:flavin reductase family protein n=1 Tax=Micropruina sp. TaxID=2737536 RepID=UPI0039E3FC2B
MTIHDSHPFATGQPRRPLRRFRGRLPAPVTIWAARGGEGPAGLTVSSMLVADGEPGEVVGLIDPASELFQALLDNRRWAVSLLSYGDRRLSDAMAGLTPAPGGPFRLAQWRDTEWGPVLATSPGWLGARLLDEPVESGWSMLVRGVVESVEIDESVAPVAYLRGSYRQL